MSDERWTGAPLALPGPRVKASPRAIDLRQMLRALRERWLLVVASVGVALLAGLAYLATTPRVYESLAQILVDPGPMVQSGPIIDPVEAQQRLATRIVVLESPLMRRQAEALLDAWGQPQAADALRQVRAEALGNADNVVRLRVRATSPREAQLGAQAVTQAYQSYALQEARSQASAGRAFLEEQIQRAGDELDQAQNALRAFQQRTGIFELESEADRLNEQLSGLETERASVQIALEARRRSLEQLEDQIAARREQLPDAATATSEQLVQKLQEELASLDAERTDLLARGLRETDPEIQSLDRRIEAARERVREEARQVAEADPAQVLGVTGYRSLLSQQELLAREIASLENQLASLDREIQGYQRSLGTLSDQGYELARLQRDVEVASNTFSLLREELERARLAEASEPTQVRVLQEPTLPGAPAEPRPLLMMALSLLLGLGGGAGLAFILDATDARVKDRDRLEEMGLAVLGEVPAIRSRGWGAEIMARPPTRSNPLLWSYLRTYLRIETGLRFLTDDLLSDEHPSRGIAVLGNVPGEGTSVTAVNLAGTLARTGQRVLLIDVDFAGPSLHQRFPIPAAPGFLELLAGQAQLGEVLHHALILEEGELDLIPAGAWRSNLLALLHSPALDEWLGRLRAGYDWLVVDAGAIRAAPEPLEVVRRLDGAVVVVKAYGTATTAVEETLADLHAARVRVLGTVLNQAKVHRPQAGLSFDVPAHGASPTPALPGASVRSFRP